MISREKAASDAALWGDRARRTRKRVAKVDVCTPRHRHFARHEGRRPESGVNLQFQNFKCNLFARNEGQTAKPGVRSRLYMTLQHQTRMF
jgi:hypothetical protein